MVSLPLKAPRFLTWFIALWLLWMSLHTYVVNNYGFSLQLAIRDSAISNILLIGICLLVSTIFAHYIPTKQKVGFIFMLCCVLTIVWVVCCYYSLEAFIKDKPANYLPFFDQSIPIRFATGLLIIGCMSLVSVLWYTQQDEQAGEKRKTETERLAKEAELNKLRQQLQPHFLFNSLNSINALIGTHPQQARSMILQLSDFLRSTLKQEAHQWISQEEELQHLKLYLEIEKVRFSHRLSTVIENEAPNNMRLPALLLQPIVENAIKFGLYDTTRELTISIHTKEEKNMLVITIQNPYDPVTTVPQHGTGFGLHSVQRRLFLLFARTDLLETKTHNHTFIVTIKIPQTNTVDGL